MKKYSIQKRKSVHIALMHETHNQLRSLLVMKDISLQAVMQEFAEKIVSGDPYAIAVIESAIESKNSKALKKLTDMEKNDIFDMIDNESPLK